MVWAAGDAVGVGGAGDATGGVVGEVVLVALVVWVPLVTAWWLAPCGCFSGEGVVVDGSGRVPSPPLAGAWWFVGSPAVVALVPSGGGGCRWRR